MFRRFNFLKLTFVLCIGFFFLGIITSLISSNEVPTGHSQIRKIISEQIKMSPNEERKYCLGIFNAGCNISGSIIEKTGRAVFYKVITYAGAVISNSSLKAANFTFRTNTDYYELVLVNNSTHKLSIDLNVKVEEMAVKRPYNSSAFFGKALTLISWVSALIILIFVLLKAAENFQIENDSPNNFNKLKTFRYFMIISLLFWFLIILFPSFSILGLERWYTDHLRHSYTSFLFTKYGFSVFNTPLGKLADVDDSHFKYVTWPEMPHLYPLGSILIFLPFGALLQLGFSSYYVFKAEIILFVIFGHLCVYLFGKRLLQKRSVHIVVKLIMLYSFYYLVILYSLNGMFDSLPLIFSVLAMINFIEERKEACLFLGFLGFFFKYQVGMFLLPLMLVSFILICKEKGATSIFRDMRLNVTFVLAVIIASTLFVSLPYIILLRKDLVMNSLYLFMTPVFLAETVHFAIILLMVFLTLFLAIYGLKRDLWLSVFVFYLILPCIILPYFQQWYFPYIFIPILLMKNKRSSTLYAIWILILIFAITMGSLRYDPVWLLEKVLSSFRW